MATTSTTSITLRGKSGTSYDFDVYPWGQQFNPVGAVYVVLQTPADGIIYVGQTGDLSERFEAHHKTACFQLHGRRYIGVHAESSEQWRFAIEADLIANYRPPCNEQGK